MAVVTMKELLETGVHFGHRRRRWHPKMKSYIFTERNGIHIIDLQQTTLALEKAYNLVRDTVAEGGVLLFVGTKRQAKDSIREQAERCGMPYVANRWLGGTLTNWNTISQRIHYLKELEEQRDRGDFELLPSKKEALKRHREIAKLQRRLGGIKEMKDLPDLVFVTDIRREYIVVNEANILDIPVIAMVDTNCDPDPIDLVVPANDDAIRANRLIITIMADAVTEGLSMRKVAEAKEAGVEEFAEEDEDARYLGEATLAKIAAMVDDKEDQEEDEESETAEDE